MQIARLVVYWLCIKQFSMPPGVFASLVMSLADAFYLGS
ncbi:hypothetical protein GARC_4519 [Paraglaciecola arctica BSs20135]|uniref:Uncharacterized protein n=1 Tax=Paraglaciecola arctica BSs20135 TaxID=493475 RepID=K6YBY5_9ALTE|nr:hypothetical protein GARC_4519 [Paraglaciecola arctica BSs20135]